MGERKSEREKKPRTIYTFFFLWPQICLENDEMDVRWRSLKDEFDSNVRYWQGSSDVAEKKILLRR